MSHSTQTIKKFCELCHWLIQIYDFRINLFDNNPNEKYLKDSRHIDFFYRICIVFQEAWMLNLAKLHDPAVMGDNTNLSLNYIIEHEDWDTETLQQLKDLKGIMDTLYVPIKEARNKLLSHNDYEAIVNNKDDAHVGVFKEGADVPYFQALKDFCELVSQKVLNTSFVYDDMVVKNDIDVFMSQFIYGKSKFIHRKSNN